MKHAVPHSLFFLSLAACVDLTGAPAPECETTDDCNAGAGEVCDEGVCWGDPPAGVYAFLVGPPAERPDLAPTELIDVDIRSDGWLDDLAVDPAVYLHGRIIADCDACRTDATVAASITVRRESRIPGGREFWTSGTSIADATTGDSFSIPLPPIGLDDPVYTVTIEPSRDVPIFESGPTPAELVPPLRLTVSVEELSGGLDVVLAADEVRTIQGRVVDAVGDGVPGYRVSARGRVDPLRPLEPVSTIATTDAEGWFTLFLGRDALDVVDVEAAPPSGAVAPTLIAHDRFIGTLDPVTLRIPLYGDPAEVTVPVVVVDTAGGETPVPVAQVELTTQLDGVLDLGVEAFFTVRGETDDQGVFAANVIGGTTVDPQEYEARIVPPPESLAASKIDVIAVDGDETVPFQLGQRTTITGVLEDASGEPAASVTVTATPSPFFTWGLDEETQARLQQRTPASTVTYADGAFTLWVDPSVAGQVASYDLACEPAEDARVPRWTFTEIEAAESIDLGTRMLPDAAHVRGLVVDAAGEPVAGASVRIYEIDLDGSVCIAENAPADCQPPAILRATSRSDERGIVHLVLPRP